MASGQPHTKRDVGGQRDKGSKDGKSKSAPSKTSDSGSAKPPKAIPKPR